MHTVVSDLSLFLASYLGSELKIFVVRRSKNGLGKITLIVSFCAGDLAYIEGNIQNWCRNIIWQKCDSKRFSIFGEVAKLLGNIYDKKLLNLEKIV